MTTSEPNPANIPLEPSPEVFQTHTPKKSPLVAGLLSTVLPGAGQFLRKQSVAAMIFLLAYAGLWFCFWPFRLPRNPLALIALVWLTMIVIVSASLHAAFARDEGGRRLHGAWALFLLLTAATTLFLHVNLMNQAAGFRGFGIPSSSMEPTVMKGDRIMVDVRAYVDAPPHRGDPVVVRHEGLYIIKRVIAVGGDTIEGRSGATYVNGQELREPYAVHHLGANARKQLLDYGPIAVPPGKLFVIGDNRDVSYDSRMPEYGPVDVQDVTGRPVYVIRRLGGDFAIPIK